MAPYPRSYPAGHQPSFQSPTTLPSSATLTPVPLTDRRRKDEPQTLDVRGQLHRGAQALADVGVEAKVGVIVADPDGSAAPGDDERLRSGHGRSLTGRSVGFGGVIVQLPEERLHVV